MPTKLTATPRRETGSSASRRLRREERIPGVVYGHGMTPVPVSVDRRELRLALAGPAGMNTILDLAISDDDFPAIVKEVQRHPVRRNVTHIDFQQVNLNEEITVSVPLHLEGEARAVMAEGAMVDPAIDAIEVVTTPRHVPNEIVVDISQMQVGDVIRLGDLTLPANVTATGDPDTPVVTVVFPTIEAEDIAEDAEAEGEDTEGEGAGGDAAPGTTAE